VARSSRARSAPAVSETAIVEEKQAVRERVWALLRERGVARFPGARGRIPNFTGAEAAAERLATLDEWRAAAALKANPDSPQLPVRRLRDERLFVRLGREATIKGAAREGTPVAVADTGRIDLVVCGTVAVNRDGVRIGKGGGYSDLEFGLLVEAGLVDDRTVLATTVHPLQVLDEPLPETDHDFRVDAIVTPDLTIRTLAPKRPQGILWGDLDAEKIAAIPVLAALASR
jgi:5-formyltetrahydrofolate cyclo-ligase